MKMTAILTGLADVGTVVTSVFGIITGNPLTAFYVSCSVIGAGFVIFLKAKHAAVG